MHVSIGPIPAGLAVASAEITAAEAAEYAAEFMPFGYYEGCLFYSDEATGRAYLLAPEGWRQHVQSEEEFLHERGVSMERAIRIAEALGLIPRRGSVASWLYLHEAR